MFGGRYLKVLGNNDLLKNSLFYYINTILIILVLNLLSVNFFKVESSFTLITIIYIIIGLLIFNIPFKRLYNYITRQNFKTIIFYNIIKGLFFIILSLFILLFSKIQMLWISSIPLILIGLDFILQSIGIIRKELFLLSVVAFVYTIFFILLQTIPQLWYSIQQFSLWFSKHIGLLIGVSLLLGPSASGLWIIIIFFIFSCCIFILSGLGKKLFLLNVIGLAICWIVYLIILGFVEFELNSDVLNLHFVLFLLCLIPTFLYLRSINFSSKTMDNSSYKNWKFKNIIKNGTVWALIFLFIFSILLTSFPGAENINYNKAKKNILFYGHNMLGSWDVPEYGKYGKTMSGMFGLLPYYLHLIGYNSKIVVEDRMKFLNNTFPINKNITRYINITDYSSIIESSNITSDLLADIDIFVVINLNKSFSLSEHKTIWKFVENGGSLLVLGDHTAVGGIMNPLNDLLKPAGISYRFDSAIPIDKESRWIPCYQLLHNPISFRINELDEIQISVGASLDINYGSFPIIIGRYGLSDIGSHLNEEKAFLGDYRYNKGEQIGDIILAACTYYGKGKVIIFGDTSPFQNVPISYTLPFLDSVFNWLCNNRTIMLDFSIMILSILFLFGTIILYLKFKEKKIQFVFFPLALCIGILISAAINPIILGESEIKGDIVYVDVSHIERFSIEPYKNTSLTGLMTNLMRNNYLPIILRDFSNEKMENCKILIFNAPTRSFSDNEVESIKKFIKNGGLVILSTGFPDKDASMPLLREFNLDIYDIPLGPVPYVEEEPEKYQKEPRFVDSWPILVGDESNTELFYSVEIEGYEYILMTFTQYGDGGLLFISDSQFLIDSNIESLFDYWPGNIQFFKNILDEMESRGLI